MKKKYLEPQVYVDLIRLEGSFLASTDPSKSSSEDLYYESEIDPWEDD